MDEIVGALLAVPVLLLGILTMASIVEIADRREQLATAAHRGVVTASAGVYADASPGEVRAGVQAAEGAAAAASRVCADQLAVTVQYYDQRTGDWMPSTRYEANTVWVGAAPDLSRARVTVECWLLPGPVPGLTPRVSHQSEVPLPSAPPSSPTAPGTDPFSGLQEQR
ncbi:MAG: hypothetical protein OXM57_14620 [bacterium]|nr:hypothetical protein [bacterium]MDE0353912.1 hypothetical protein [bacterium]